MTRRGAGAIDSGKLIRWFDFQAPLYRLWRDDYNGPLVTAVLGALRAEPARHVLDAACGTGLFTLGLARAEPHLRVEAIDASAGMLGVAKRQASRLRLANLGLHRGDVLWLPFRDRSFDVVVAGGLVPCLNEPGRALSEFHRVLVDGGRLMSVEFDRTAMGLGLRIFFNAMIAGYHTVSGVFSRFRFAKRWNVARSTIDPAHHERALRASGFELLDAQSVAGHRLYHARKR